MIPLHVDVPMTRLPWMNWVLIGVVTIVSVAGLVDESIAGRLGGFSSARAIEFEQLGSETEIQHKHLPKPLLAITSTFVHAGLFTYWGTWCSSGCSATR